MRPAFKFILLLLAGAVPLSAALCDYHLTPASPEANLISVGWIADDGQDCAIRTKDGKSIGVEKVAFEGKTYWNAAIKREKSSGPVGFVVSASGKSETLGSIPAEPAGEFRFAVAGDVQGKGPSDKWRKAADWLASKKPTLFIPVGDLVEQGLDSKQWEAFFADGANLFKDTLILPVIGNHDCYKEASGALGLKPEIYLNQFRLPPNGVDGCQGYWYSFNCGDAHFAVLCNFPVGTGLDQKKGEKIQAEWLENDLTSCGKKWKFVFFHVPIYSTGPHGGDTISLAKTWGDIIERHGVNVVFNGHTHALEITPPLKGGQPAEKGTVYYNCPGINFSCKPKGGTLTRFAQSEDRMLLATLVTVSSARVVVATYDLQTGELCDEFKME